MARRIITSQQVEEKLHAMRNRSRYSAVAVSVVVLAAVALALYLTRVLLPAEAPAAFVAYVTGDVEEAGGSARRRDLSANALDAVPPVEIVVAVEASASSVPTLDASAISSAALESGGSFDLGESVGVGGGFGRGMGEGSAGMGNQDAEASAFCGRFWDLKKTGRGAPSRYQGSESSNQVVDLESRFYTGGWKAELFDEFFESPVKLYASCFLMPICLDEEATNAYDPTGRMKLQSSRWIAVYSAWVKAPVSGRFRFVGIADSVMAVRFDGANVLQCGLYNLEGGANSSNFREESDFIKYDSCQKWNEMLGGFVPGEFFEVEEGKWYRMDVLVSEIGGLGFGFCLLIDEERTEKQKTPDGAPLYQLFRTTFAEPDISSLYAGIRYPFREAAGVVRVEPPYDRDSRVWQAVPIDGKKRPPAGAVDPGRRRR